MNKWQWIGLSLIACGVVYLLKPTVFRRGLWLKTSVAIRKLSPEAYLRYMRGLGVLYIGLGIAAVIYGYCITP